MTACKECEKPLNKVEIWAYENRCEQCETEWCEEIERWRHGEPNSNLDKLYGNPEILN